MAHRINIRSNAASQQSREWLTRTTDAEAAADLRLEINVIFTKPHGAQAALKIARKLARNLRARIVFVVPQPVPYPLPLASPPVSAALTERRFGIMASPQSDEATETQVRILLCRNVNQCLLQALRPQSLVVIGGRKRWWPTQEQKLATLLRRSGHHVIFANSR